MVNDYRKLLMIESYSSAIEREKALIKSFEEKIDKIKSECQHEITVCLDRNNSNEILEQEECECLFCMKKMKNSNLINACNINTGFSDKEEDFQKKRNIVRRMFSSYLYDKKGHSESEITLLINDEIDNNKECLKKGLIK